MRKHPGVAESITPLNRELKALFAEIPDGMLLASLKTYHAGRRGYGATILWRTYVAQAHLNLPSFAALIRALQDNPSLQASCGIADPSGIPSKFAYSRFMRKLRGRFNVVKVKNIFREIVRRCYDEFPDFAKSVAIDATDIKGWVNGRHPKTDPDAGWVVKPDTHGHLKYTLGFKVHALVDTRHELPVAMLVSKGNVHESRVASNVLQEARVINPKFHPRYVMGDAGYSSKALRQLIRRQYRAVPIIKVNPSHKKAARVPMTPEQRRLYHQRVAVERWFGRAKSHRRLNSVTVRGLAKVTVHLFISFIVTAAWALAMPQSPRQLVRAA